MRNRWLVPVGAVAATLVIAACGSTSSPGTSGSGSGSGSSPAASASGALAAKKMGSTMVLTNAKGFTLYWFVPDTKTASKCYGSCAKYWPFVPGPASAGSGVTGTLGVITRSNGAKQATFDGHPLYTYVGDTAPGEAKGNGLNISGGVWHEVALTGKAGPAPGSSPSSGGGAYGY